MRTFPRRPWRLATLGIAIAGALAVAAPAARSASGNVFLNLAGSWVGRGLVTDGRGVQEGLRCRVSYGVLGDASALSQNLVCASASYRFAVTAAIYDRGGTVSGTWNETTRGISGNVRGYIRGNYIVTSVDGPGFSAGLTIASNGRTQNVTIQPRGGDIRWVSISFRR